MGKVIDLETERFQRTSSVCGPCKCASCDYEWYGILDPDCFFDDNTRTALECPQCHKPTGGILRVSHFDADAHIFKCGCGSTLLQAVSAPDGLGLYFECGYCRTIHTCATVLDT